MTVDCSSMFRVPGSGFVFTVPVLGSMFIVPGSGRGIRGVANLEPGTWNSSEVR